MRLLGFLFSCALVAACAPTVDPLPEPQLRIVGETAEPARVPWPRPHVGVVDSVAFRHAPGSTLALSTATGRAALAPVRFSEQIGGLGYTAFHFRVFADPDPGSYGGLGAGNIAALRQAGLKVFPAGGVDRQAECFTLMTCLMALDQASLARPEHPPLVVVLEPSSLGALDWAPEPIARWREPVPGVVSRWIPRRKPRPMPDILQIAREVEHVLAPERRATRLDADAAGKFVVIVATRGYRPPQAPFMVANADGRDAQALAASEPDWRLAHARKTADAVVVLGADWQGDTDPMRISAREAAAGLADVVLLAQSAAQQ